MKLIIRKIKSLTVLTSLSIFIIACSFGRKSNNNYIGYYYSSDGESYSRSVFKFYQDSLFDSSQVEELLLRSKRGQVWIKPLAIDSINEFGAYGVSLAGSISQADFKVMLKDSVDYYFADSLSQVEYVSFKDRNRYWLNDSLESKIDYYFSLKVIRGIAPGR